MHQELSIESTVIVGGSLHCSVGMIASLPASTRCLQQYAVASQYNLFLQPSQCFPHGNHAASPDPVHLGTNAQSDCSGPQRSAIVVFVARKPNLIRGAGISHCRLDFALRICYFCPLHVIEIRSECAELTVQRPKSQNLCKVEW